MGNCQNATYGTHYRIMYGFCTESAGNDRNCLNCTDSGQQSMIPTGKSVDWSGYHPDKDNLRTEVWSLLKQQGVGVRDPFGHIPNFVGAQKD